MVPNRKSIKALHFIDEISELTWLEVLEINRSCVDSKTVSFS